MKKSRRRRNAIVTAVALLSIAAIVVYSSFQVSTYECDVCISFRGREACRTVAGQTKEEALRSAVDNACALLAGGMTDSLACSRTNPTKAECREL